MASTRNSKLVTLSLTAATLLAIPAVLLAQWAASGNNIYNTNSGKVGIGTSAPVQALEVVGYSKLGGMAILNADTGYEWWTGPFTDFESWQLTRRKIADGSWSNSLTVKTNGNIGLGTTTPTSKLHVVGDVTVSGNIAAKYQDVAEWVEAVAPAAAGTVMALAGTGRDAVRPSNHAYDTAVAGVVSPRPGVILGERGPGKVLVAHSGRVRVRADASYGAIRAGDLLVTSPTPGHAMRSQPLTVGDVEFHRPGTLLGKAIEPLADGTGEILVLLTLQ